LSYNITIKKDEKKNKDKRVYVENRVTKGVEVIQDNLNKHDDSNQLLFLYIVHNLKMSEADRIFKSIEKAPHSTVYPTEDEDTNSTNALQNEEQGIENAISILATAIGNAQSDQHIIDPEK